ncbi:DUF5906 domain-containing protein [Methylomagnum ishizawai]|uniref:DUF5906 domain-containing protein n=1 Tax=Methylomagnum ishizawai TaxID=1760988 RepID=UPI001C325F0B|nr:DUF5906 domain-containing protein [Methylomagnum ishizawai]BBL75600.1 hypothetical protein MishRS11D_26980 [Methylomagnum ishizawai]
MMPGPQKQEIPPTRHNVWSALRYVSPSCDHRSWFRILAAIKDALGEDGRDIADEWSQEGDSYDKAAFRDAWKSAKPGGKVTIATLWRMALDGGWKPDSEARPETEAERQEREQRRKARAEQAAKQQAEAAQTAATKAAALWKAARPARPEHPYLGRKRAKPVEALREIPVEQAASILGYPPKSDGEALAGLVLVVPVKVDGKLSTVELIDGQGRKTAIAGGPKAGGFWAAQTLPEGDGGGLTLAIGEGVATVLSCREAVQWSVFAALSASNLPNIARILRARCPAARIVIVGDIGGGLEYARQAAEAVGAALAVPAFTDEQTMDWVRGHSKPPTDFNDLHQVAGLDAVARQLRRAVDGEPRPVPPIPAAIPAPPPESRPKVIDFSQKREARLAFEARIVTTDDIDILVHQIGKDIAESSLPEAIKVSLFKQAGKRAGVGWEVLRKSAESGDSGGGDNHDDTIPPYISELNKYHAIVHMQGKTRIMSVVDNPESKRQEVTFSARNDFLLRYENRIIRVDGDDVSWAEAWLKHPTRREYSHVVFTPGLLDSEMPPGTFNLWRGWGLEPRPGYLHQSYLDMVRDVICAGDEEAYGYILGWMAHLVQYPADLPGAALLLRSGQRTGKGTFAEALGQIVGLAHYIELTNTAHLTGQFSGHLANALLVFANEATWGGDKAHEGALKAMITDPNALMEAKRENAAMVRNYKRVVIATNNSFPVPRDMDDARFVVLDVSEAHKEDHEYFGRIKGDLQGGGLESLFYYLLYDVDITGFHPRKIPMKLREAGWDLKIKSADSMVQWYYACLCRGWMFPESEKEPPYWANTARTYNVRSQYEYYCKFRNIPHHKQIDEGTFGKALKKWGVGKKKASSEGRPWEYIFPRLNLARAAFGSLWGIPPGEWDDDG